MKKTTIQHKTLAEDVKDWRGKTPAREAARLLGIPKRTLDGIEQGRDFRYPDMLRLAMRSVKIPA